MLGYRQHGQTAQAAQAQSGEDKMQNAKCRMKNAKWGALDVVHFHYVPSAHLPQLPTPPRGGAVEVVFRREQPNSTGGTLTRVPINFTGATHD